ncbi:hypothetical protein J8273_0370 [Carpediemonas membranifera]|uniref:Uncharacterized protein n=1 Tax=Carpediemonas membranifera TaxID=201153 RepID=A0A8J6BZ36_9EUKA|nr:hypothetical protein J8273_0370 [Carpediemonas membranifera]|eukprot:KAG9395151.1 hypothetical protein J8273_0370 [Carpediemonas membranifera]
MAATSTGATELKDALAGLHRLATIATADVPGDVPSLIAGAFHRQFREEMPSLHDHTEAYEATTGATADKLLARLAELPPLEPNAQLLLDRAHSILTSGPPLSMNVELADGEELPVALHTLLQGTLWACMMGGEANPDLDGAQDDDNAYSSTDKCLWFLCKKLFFAHCVASKDGETVVHALACRRLYQGRLFARPRGSSTPAVKYARLPCPTVLTVHWQCFPETGAVCTVLVTARGLYGVGCNARQLLGMPAMVLHAPTRLTFPFCPVVAAYEQGLPPWHKDRLVRQFLLTSTEAFLVTPVGVAVAGFYSHWAAGAMDIDRNAFNPVKLPTGFIPELLTVEDDVATLTDADGRRMVARFAEDDELVAGAPLGFVDEHAD